MKALSVIIPVYNEADSIGPVVDRIRSVLDGLDLAYEIIAVNDASTDGSQDILKEKKVRLIRHQSNRGYGACLKDGIRAARFERVLITDGDGTYPVEAIPTLLGEADSFDMVVGARTGEKVAIPPHRRIPKWLLKKMADYLSGMKIPDLNSGLRVFTRSAALQFINILPDGFSFTTTITLAFLSNSYSIRYLPINYHHRRGRSKFRPLQDTFNLLTLIVRTSLYFNPLKIFVPFGLILFALALLVLLYSKFFTPQVMDITVIVIFMAGVQMLGLGLIADLVDKRTRQ